MSKSKLPSDDNNSEKNNKKRKLDLNEVVDKQEKESNLLNHLYKILVKSLIKMKLRTKILIIM